MARGIIYVMTTVVPGLIKIGKTGTSNFESRMYTLEHNGYFNVVGLHRRFAIEVDNYDQKETMLDDIFAKSRVPNSELFALDVDLVVQLLSSFEGKQIYPEPDVETKTQVFKDAAAEHESTIGWDKVPDGIYHLSHKVKGRGVAEANMKVEDGSFIVLKGSKCIPVNPSDRRAPDIAKKAVIIDGVLQEDVPCPSPSTAGWVVIGKSNNGWSEWRDENGFPIDVYRGPKDKVD